ncbi:hypothetical protein C0995_002339, partial [Termitomyces sp. Mi166
MFPSASEELLGGLPAILFGDFAQLPPIGDTPLYSSKTTGGRHLGLALEGHRAFESFMQSITLSHIFCQEGEDPDQIRFRDALLRLRTYSTLPDDYNLLSTRFWGNITAEERTRFNDALHLLPTRVGVQECNTRRLAGTGQPVVHCQAKHNSQAAKKASEEDADGLEPMILLAEGAR